MELALIQQRSILFHHEMQQPFLNIASQVSDPSKRLYLIGARTFDEWLSEKGYTLATIDRSGIFAYRDYLAHGRAKATAARLWSVARRLLQECQHLGARPDFPVANVKGFQVENTSPHIALSRQQVCDILESIDRSTSKGLRDYALFMLLVRTGIRRKECEHINIGDFFQEQGYTMLTIQHGKGDKRRNVKIPVDVFRAIQEYISATGRTFTSLTDPLFVGFDRGQHPTRERMGERTIERSVIACGQLIGMKHLTPHDLRTTFNTITKKGGATLEQRQHAMGHSRPETTQRYDKDKAYLDDNAVDHFMVQVATVKMTDTRGKVYSGPIRSKEGN